MQQRRIGVAHEIVVVDRTPCCPFQSPTSSGSAKVQQVAPRIRIEGLRGLGNGDLVRASVLVSEPIHHADDHIAALVEFDVGQNGLRSHQVVVASVGHGIQLIPGERPGLPE